MVLHKKRGITKIKSLNFIFHAQHPDVWIQFMENSSLRMTEIQTEVNWWTLEKRSEIAFLPDYVQPVIEKKNSFMKKSAFYISFVHNKPIKYKRKLRAHLCSLL